jgi:hypothetical protein
LKSSSSYRTPMGNSTSVAQDDTISNVLVSERHGTTYHHLGTIAGRVFSLEFRQIRTRRRHFAYLAWLRNL